MQSEPTRQSDEIIPPIQGSILALAAGTAIVVVDVTTWLQSLALPATTVKGSEHTNAIGTYISLVADGVPNVYVGFAPTYAKAAALTVASTTTVNGTTGVLTILGTEMYMLTAGANYNFRPPPGPSSTASGQSGGPWGANSAARFMAFCTATSTAVLRAQISSR